MLINQINFRYFIISMILVISCNSDFQVNKKEYYVVRFTTNISEYNEFYCDQDKQYFYDGSVGEVYEIEETEGFFKEYYKMLLDQKNEELIKDSIFSYLKINALSDGDSIKNFEFIDIEAKQLSANEYRWNCRERMLEFIRKSDSFDGPESTDIIVEYDTF